ncbi:hypothetical protein [Bizionia arctica]|uniref:DUF4168 domain-containing protein n=1 Tax=Bizionia arctica TaxID=1495645 RepID=A0A917GE45_9FLAO|nr:hypothetical protein [Bizionia arctica]GGG41003.1 hypothetical protein GCM10010976_10780 [Bizionia arctica]
MKKLVFLFFAFAMMQVSAQNLSSIASSASSGSMIENLASDQVKNLTKKLNLSESQQQLVSGLVVSQLKSEKFQKLLGSLGADKLMGSSNTSDNTAEQTDKIQSALLGDEGFQKEMGSVLDKKQMETMKSYIPR